MTDKQHRIPSSMTEVGFAARCRCGSSTIRRTRERHDRDADAHETAATVEPGLRDRRAGAGWANARSRWCAIEAHRRTAWSRGGPHDDKSARPSWPSTE
jgi:hypothetical protein